MSTKLGDRVWRFNENRRRYEADKSTPIWREHWEPFYIVGENRASWLLAVTPAGSSYKKCPKRPNPVQRREWAFSEEEINDREWDEKNRWRILDRARYALTTAQLRQVADMIGFKP